MSAAQAPFELLLITPDRDPAAILAQSRRALQATSVRDMPGRLAVQLRSKTLAAETRARLGRELAALGREHGVPLLVNGDLELARALGAMGVQLPESGPTIAAARAALPSAWIGASRHDAAGVRAAGDASFVLVAPVFAVPGKGPALGLDGLAALAVLSPVPLVALGGIDASNAPAVRAAGAAAIAVMREVYDAADPARAVDALLARTR